MEKIQLRRTIETLTEWETLPELPIPKISSNREQGNIYSVIRVGFLMIRTSEGRVPYPTITIEDKKDGTMYRLPLELNAWAFDCVAHANAGMNFFPERVEFCNINGHYTADIR